MIMQPVSMVFVVSLIFTLNCYFFSIDFSSFKLSMIYFFGNNDI